MRRLAEFPIGTLLLFTTIGGLSGCKRDESPTTPQMVPPPRSPSTEHSQNGANEPGDHLAPAALDPQPPRHQARWTRISYADLVNKDQLTQSGSTIGSLLPQLLAKPHLKGELQPFLSPFANLLPHALDMILKTAELPRMSLAETYAPGVAQPAWAAIVRSGRIVVTDDGNATATAFLPGNDAEQAYRTNYSVLRHMLLALLPPDPTALKVFAYAYVNNFSPCELHLNLDPYVVAATDFPPLAGKTPIDIVGLREFFNQGCELVGGHLDDRARLILVGKKGEPQRLAGEPADFSDLAVAYRAVFHCEDSGAFVSLDPHRDATQVTVSFGGLLEDTRLGAVVLQADRRFKTITSGLDPTSFADIRAPVRAAIPDFVSVGERDLCSGTFDERAKWVGTRFWYYPESVEIEADLAYRSAIIKRAQFTADAERSRDDFATSQDFDQYKKTHLSPSIRENIRHLNEHYSDYAKVFPELKELSVVARLMGVCIWLKRANIANLDLDALLAVKLPAYQTPRQSRKLMAASVMINGGSATLGLPDVQQGACVRYLSNILDKRVEEVFSSDEKLAEYLSLLAGENPGVSKKFMRPARRFRDEHTGQTVRETIRTEADLRALAEYAASEVDCPASGSLAVLDADIKAMEKKAEVIKRELARVDLLMSRGVNEHNSHVSEYNDLVMQQRRIVAELNAAIDRYNANVGSGRVVTEIGGGISMESDRFTVRSVRVSKEIEQIRSVTKASEGSIVEYDGERWIKTRPYDAGSAERTSPLARGWRQGEGLGSTDSERHSAATDSGERYWRLSKLAAPGWRDQLLMTGGRLRERLYTDGGRTLQVADWEQGELKSIIVGRFVADDQIIFELSSRRDLMQPESPPSWWEQEREQGS